VGKVTVTMLKRNLLRLYDYQQGKQYQQEQQQKEMINR
jgi:methylenetetrahydrofolate dehydrogenase (NAD+)